jgi:Ethylbenzene dehydrogenase/Prokaryotic cytochrome b561
MRRRWTRKTDTGTVVLHWLLVATLTVSTVTGLRIASDGQSAALAKFFADFLPSHNIWFFHIIAGIGVLVIAAAYPIYLRGTGLGRRISLDRTRLAALFKSGSARWGTVNIVLYWLLFALLVIQLASGILLHRGFGGSIVDLHHIVTWLMLGYMVAHILAHFAVGGWRQLARVFRPSPIPASKRPLFEEDGPVFVHRANLFSARTRLVIVTCIAGLAAALGFFLYDRLSRDVLYVTRLPKGIIPRLSGDLSDPVWRSTKPLFVRTQQGANLDGTGESTVEIRAVHDDQNAYFAFTWQDSTRSLKHFPLIKQADGWHLLQHEGELPQYKFLPDVTLISQAVAAEPNPSNFEDTYSEDKFSVMLSNQEKRFGPGAFHIGRQPIAEMPPSSSGRGLHYTSDNSIVEVWLWHADSGTDTDQCDDDHIAGPAQPTPEQAAGIEPYRGGYTSDKSKHTMLENYRRAANQSVVTPRMLPRDLAVTHAAMGDIDLDCDHGEAENARWWTREEDAVPYSSDRDSLIPVGTIIPGVITPTQVNRTPDDLQCSARWAAGRWTLIAQRHLDTHHPGDITIGDGTFMWVAVFDHTPSRHTRHIRPIQLELK